jgi:hypothetical protein
MIALTCAAPGDNNGYLLPLLKTPLYYCPQLATFREMDYYYCELVLQTGKFLLQIRERSRTKGLGI